eukprot:SAG31_NODE_8393_length_1460_cov_1.161646_3_plen_101_part_00
MQLLYGDQVTVLNGIGVAVTILGICFYNLYRYHRLREEEALARAQVAAKLKGSKYSYTRVGTVADDEIGCDNFANGSASRGGAMRMPNLLTSGKATSAVE